MKKKILLLCSLLLVITGCASNKYAQEFGVFDIVYPSEDIFDLANKRKIREGEKVSARTDFIDINYEVGRREQVSVHIEAYYEDVLEGVAYGYYEHSISERKPVEERDLLTGEWGTNVFYEEVPFKYEKGIYYDASSVEISRLNEFKFLFQFTDLSFKHTNGTIKTSKNPVPTYFADGIVTQEFGNAYFEAMENTHGFSKEDLSIKNIYYRTDTGFRAWSDVWLTEREGKGDVPRTRLYEEITGIGESSDFEDKKRYEEVRQKNG